MTQLELTKTQAEIQQINKRNEEIWIERTLDNCKVGIVTNFTRMLFLMSSASAPKEQPVAMDPVLRAELRASLPMQGFFETLLDMCLLRTPKQKKK